MNREHCHDEPIELGAATDLTQGAVGTYEDQEFTLRAIPGLTDD